MHLENDSHNMHQAPPEPAHGTSSEGKTLGRSSQTLCFPLGLTRFGAKMRATLHSSNMKLQAYDWVKAQCLQRVKWVAFHDLSSSLKNSMRALCWSIDLNFRTRYEGKFRPQYLVSTLTDKRTCICTGERSCSRGEIYLDVDQVCMAMTMNAVPRPRVQAPLWSLPAFASR